MIYDMFPFVYSIHQSSQNKTVSSFLFNNWSHFIRFVSIFIKITPISDTNNVICFMIKNDAVITDGRGEHGQGDKEQRHQMADDVVLVVVDVGEEVVVQHAPQAAPHVDRGEVTEEDGEHVERL